MSAAIRVARAEDLDRAAILAIAGGQQVDLAPDLRERIALRRRDILTALADGRPVYGVNTGMGAQSGVRLTLDEQSRHQNNLLLARAVGGPPWLGREQVRALFAVRLRTFLSGDAGVSPELVELLVAFLNAGVHPAVPRSGYGTAGEIISLAHAFGPLTGVGSVLAGAAIADATPVLHEQGLTAIALGPKEGIALLQGVPGATAQALLVTERVRTFIDQSIAGLAIGLIAAGLPRDQYRAELARADTELTAVTSRLREQLGEAEDAPRALQAPVSFRVAGASLAHLTRVAAAVDAAVDRALSGVTDSPAYVDGEFLGTAGFHGLDLAAGLDALSAALVHAAEVSMARTHRLLDAKVTGLSAQLATNPGPDTGLITVHKRAAGIVHQLRRTSMSSIVGSIESSFGQEDVQTFSWEAAANARTALDGATDVLAGELFTALHALTLSGKPVTVALEPTVRALRSVVAPIGHDRIFGPDIDTVRQLLSDGQLGS